MLAGFEIRLSESAIANIPSRNIRYADSVSAIPLLEKKLRGNCAH